MRKLGPVWKRSRRLSFSILGSGVELKKRSYAPGQHGQDKKKISEYGRQLTEKQKLRDMYGVNERQFRRLYTVAVNTKGITGTIFMDMLESRVDNLVFRMGFASTRKAARQLVNHGHIRVNGQKIDIPSYICSVGDAITVKDNPKSKKLVKTTLDTVTIFPPYVEVDKEKLIGKFVRLPERSELPQDINESLIVEYYNRLL
jgi:small subunit ribosomal protein S4